MLFFFFENMAGPLPFIKKEDSKVQTMSTVTLAGQNQQKKHTPKPVTDPGASGGKSPQRSPRITPTPKEQQTHQQTEKATHKRHKNNNQTNQKRS
jgi:hypothetical protein